MWGDSLESVFMSPQMLKYLATEIINACESMSVVRFGRWGSGEGYSVGLFNDGRIDLFTCAEDMGIYPGRGEGNQLLRWGIEFCSI